MSSNEFRAMAYGLARRYAIADGPPWDCRLSEPYATALDYAIKILEREEAPTVYSSAFYNTIRMLLPEISSEELGMLFTFVHIHFIKLHPDLESEVDKDVEKFSNDCKRRVGNDPRRKQINVKYLVDEVRFQNSIK